MYLPSAAMEITPHLFAVAQLSSANGSGVPHGTTAVKVLPEGSAERLVAVADSLLGMRAGNWREKVGAA